LIVSPIYADIVSSDEPETGMIRAPADHITTRTGTMNMTAPVRIPRITEILTIR
jgi:hypothetical protein